ncbi:MAG TPA: ABC transporter permease [Pyrinomonadaceae bacterium]|jgi:predicted permease|nr:ABC transporter permease [Pyrinomonadaceae bacterium]
MTLRRLRAWVVRLGGLFDKGRRDRELAEELETHLQMQVEDNLRSGMSPEEARRQAVIKLGGVESAKEEYRERRGVPAVESLLRDLRYALRTLRRNPGFTAVAVLTLALGIGATTAIFSVVYATLFEPLPYPKPEQLVMVWSSVNQKRNSVSTGDYLEWKRRGTSFQYLEAWTGATFNVATDERPEQVQAALMTPGFFRMTGTPMYLGRDFMPEEGEPGRDRVVVMTHRLWSKYFGADRGIIGRQIRMNGEPYTVVGVTPPGMRDRQQSQLMLPLALKPEQVNHQGHSLLVMGRLKDGVSLPQANAEMQAITQQLTQEFPQTNTNWAADVEPLQNNFIPENTIKNLWLLLGAVSFLLLIGCVNIANLLLARGTTRRREVAIRASLGATRAQLFAQFLTESLVLALVGGALGVYLGRLIIDGILAILPFQMLPSEADVRLSIPVLLFTVSATAFAGVLFGCAPAWQASRLDLNEALKQGGRTGGGGGRLRRALVVLEFAMALVLLAGGGLALLSFWNLTRLDLGVRTDHVLTFSLPLPQGRFKETERISPYYRQLLEKIESVPGVETAAVTTGLPLRGTGLGRPFRIDGAPVAEPSMRQGAGVQLVTPGYFDTFGIRVVKGRHFNEQDNAAGARVAMVNETFANRHLSGVDALAQRVVLNQMLPGSPQGGPELEWQVVGVFHDTRVGDGLRGDDAPVIYLPFWQSPWPRASVAVRTKGDPELVTRSLAAAVNSVDADIPLAGVKTMEQVLSETLSFDRFGLVLYGSFAALALLLAAIGIYGVMAFAVAQRTHEFGVRMALGAAGGQIMRLVLREGVTLALFGLALGLGGAYLLGRAMQANLYGVSALDVRALGAVAFVLLAASLLACYFPARRASRVNPMAALRDE